MSASALGHTEELTVGMSLLTQGADQFTGTASYIHELLREFGRQQSGAHPRPVQRARVCGVSDHAGDNVRITQAAHSHWIPMIPTKWRARSRCC